MRLSLQGPTARPGFPQSIGAATLSGMFEVTVEDWFAAAHQLRLADGRLEPLHGHNWRVRVNYAGPKLDAIDVLLDFTKLKPLLKSVLAPWHDRNLNELNDFIERNPSAEMVAVRIAERLTRDPASGPLLHWVEVEEAPGCVARYSPK